MKILYYKEPKSALGGVNNVAYYLSRAMAEKADVTYFPQTMTARNGSAIFEIYKKYVKKQFDVIQFNTVPMGIDGSYILIKFAKTMGIKTFLNIHGIIPLEHKLDPKLGSISRSDLFLVLTSCKLADKIIVNTEFMRNRVVAWYGVGLDKLVVIPNGINIREFSECDDRITLDGSPAILAVGYFSRLKGFDLLIEAVAKLRSKLPNIKLHVVGSGYEGYLNLLKEKGIENFVVFHGMVDHSKVCSYLKSADIFIMPSRHEGFPITLLEAMSSGIPVIASNIGSLKEIISDGKDGILFQTENTEELANSILMLSANEDLRKRISHEALKTAAKYDWKNVSEKYLTLYKSPTTN